jgi:PAS domain S-box-containing protein
MDIRIRGDKDGIQTTKLINDQFDVPVIFLTAYADSETMNQIKATDAYGFLVKPASEQAIQGSIDLAIYKHTMDKKLREREEKLAHQNQVLMAIRNVDQLITKEMNIDKLIQGACDNLIESLGYTRAWIALYDDHESLSKFAYAGFSNSVKPLEKLLSSSVSQYPPCVRQAFLVPEVNVMKDEEYGCHDCPLKKEFRDYGRFSMCLSYGGKAYGIMSVAVPSEFVNDHEERMLFKELVDDVAFALYRIELEEKREFAETMLKNRERTITTLMNNLPGMAYRHMNDESCTIKFISNGCKQITGYQPIELVNNKRIAFYDMIHPEDRTKFREAISHPDGPNRQYEMTYRIQTVDGSIKWVWERGSYTDEDDQGNEIMEGVIHDITEKVETEQALRESEEKYRALVENMSDFVFMFNRDLKLISMNKAASGYLRSSEDRLIGKPLIELFPGELAEKYIESMNRVFETGEPLIIERKASIYNREFWLVASLSPVKDESGRVTAVIGSSRDITAKKVAEQSLKDSEERYRAIVEDQTELIIRWLPDGTRTYVNDSYCKYYRKTYDELAGKNFLRGIKERDLKRIQEKIGKLTPEKPVATDEHHRTMPDGTLRWHQWTDRAIFDERRNIREIQSVGRDITLRKIAEEELKLVNARMKAVLENTDECIMIADSQGNPVMFNSAYAAIMKEREEMQVQLKSKSSREIWMQHGERLNHLHKKVLNGVKFSTEFSIPASDGTLRFFDLHLYPIKEKDTVRGFTEYAREITSRKKIEEHLKEREQHLTSLFLAAPVGIGVVVNRVIISVNNEICNMTGYTSEELIGKSARILYPDQKEFDFVGEQKYRQIRKLGKGSVETRWVRKDHGIRNILLSSTAIDPADLSKGVTFTAMDITERKLSEKIIQEKEIKLQKTIAELEGIINALPGMISVVDKEYRVIQANEAVIRIFGQSRPEEVLGKRCYVVRKHRKTVCPQCAIKQAFESGRMIERVSTPDEEALMGIATKSYAIPIKDGQGKTVGGVEVIMDITDLRRVEKAYRENEERFRTLIEQAADAVYLCDMRGRIVAVNQKSVENLGFSRQALLKMTIMDVVKGLKTEKEFRKVWSSKTVGYTKEFDAVHVRKDGSEFPVEARVSVIEIKGEKHILGFIRDITERKNTERLIKEKTVLLTSQFENSPDIILIVDRDLNIITINRIADNYTKRKLTGKNAISILPVSERKRAEQAVRECFRTGKIQELTHTLHDDTWVQARIVPIRQEKMINQVMIISTDITERKKAETEIRNLARFPNENPYPVLRVTANGQILYANEAARPLLMSWDAGVGKHLPAKWKRIVTSALDSGKRENVEITIKDRVFSLTVTPINEANYVNLYGIDVTERKQAETAIQNSHERLQMLSAKLILSQEEERKRLSRELHDEMGQALTAIKLNIASLKKKESSIKSGVFQETLQQTDMLVEQLLDEMHYLALELRPSILDDLGLIPALNWYAKQFVKRFGIKIRVETDELKGRLSTQQEVVIYRTVQEALTNAAKYAKASRIVIRLSHEDSAFIAAIRDNGQGFDIKEVESRKPENRGIGFVGIQERAAAVDGRVLITSKPGKGTTVKVILPLE